MSDVCVFAGIAFLRGFQVTLQSLGSSGISCQLFLFPRNVSLTASQAHTVKYTALFVSAFIWVEHHTLKCLQPSWICLLCFPLLALNSNDSIT